MRPTLSANLEIIRVGPKRFLILSPRTNNSFEVGLRERYLLKLMDGRHTFEEILQRFKAYFGETISPKYLSEFLNHLKREQLLVEGEHTQQAEEEVPSHLLCPPVPFSSADSGARLNHRFDLLVMAAGWLISPLWTAPILVFALIALAGLTRNFSAVVTDLAILHYTASVPIIFLALLVKLFLLDLPKALMFGIACRKYGGRVHRFGFRLYRGILPVLECDIGNSADTMPRNAWLAVSTVRVWTLLAITSIAGLFWSLLEPGAGLRRYLLMTEILGLIHLFVVLNIFLRLDGYAMLVRAVAEPRLYTRARAEVKAWLSWRTSPEPLTPRERFWFRVYGLSSIMFTFVIRVAIVSFGTWWLIKKYQGIGALVAIALCLAWYGGSIRERFMDTSAYRWSVRLGGEWYIRWPLRLIILVVMLGIGFLPYHHEVGGQCRLLPQTQYGVRAQVSDEIVKVFSKEGDWVDAGASIVKLSGRDVESAVKTAEAELAKSQAELDLMLMGAREEELNIARGNVDRLRVELVFQNAELKRTKGLVDKKVASERELARVQREQSIALESLLIAKNEAALLENGHREEEIRAKQAEIDGIKARLELHKRDQEMLDVRTPIAGRIVTPYLSERLGQTAAKGDLIAVVQDTSKLKVEIAADEPTATVVRKGMPVKIRLVALDGSLLEGKVMDLAYVAETEKRFGTDPFRTDKEVYIEQSLGYSDDDHMFRLYAELEEAPADLVPGMTGYARIVIDEGILWTAIFRPIVRFIRTDVWSWLP